MPFFFIFLFFIFINNFIYYYNILYNFAIVLILIIEIYCYFMNIKIYLLSTFIKDIGNLDNTNLKSIYKKIIIIIIIIIIYFLFKSKLFYLGILFFLLSYLYNICKFIIIIDKAIILKKNIIIKIDSNVYDKLILSFKLIFKLIFIKLPEILSFFFIYSFLNSNTSNKFEIFLKFSYFRILHIPSFLFHIIWIIWHTVFKSYIYVNWKKKKK